MKRALTGFLLLLFFSSSGRAERNLPILLEDGAPAKITVNSCFDNLPTVGYAAITVDIDNKAARPQRWIFAFSSPSFGFYAPLSMASEAELTVPANSARTFQLLVPLALTEHENTYSAPLAVNVSGPGASGRSSAVFQVPSRSTKPVTPFVAISDSLGTKPWGQLEKEIEHAGNQISGSRFRPEQLPDDWRAFIGIAGLWITNSEYDRLSGAQREALRDWIHRGGILFFCGVAEPPADLRSTAFGRVTAIPSPELDIEATALAIRSLNPTLQAQLHSDYGVPWQTGMKVEPIKASVPLLIGFMALFAVVVGPINLFVFAGVKKRHRLFWTTPVISLAGSALLFVVIVFQDGFGGSGTRIALIEILPGTRKSVILQEQISRTGILRSSSFTTSEPAFVAPIILDRHPNAVRRKYENVGTHFSGDFFGSRSVQAHWIESMSPTRGEVTLLNPGEIENDQAAPMIVSSIRVPLQDFYFRDSKTSVWQGTNIRPGEKATLHRGGAIIDLFPREAGPRLRDAWSRVRDEPGYFYAVSSDSASFAETLPAIRWNKQKAIFTGPVTMAPASAR
jgi:hypothetical protein